MELKELRVNNWVEITTGQTMQQFVITDDMFASYLTAQSNIKLYFPDVKPVILTKEWVIKFGFKESGLPNTYFRFSGQGSRFQIYENENGWVHVTTQTVFWFVNELQNFYLDKTGEDIKAFLD